MSQPNVTPVSPVPARTKMNTKTVVSLAMLTGIAYVVMLVSKLMPGVMFLDFDFKDVVICIGGFTFGPLAAALISTAVALIEMVAISHTGLWGFLMNVLATCAFCCTASVIYQKLHTKKGAVIGLFGGIAALVVIMLLWNWLITPIYMGLPRADVVAMLPTLFLPFNWPPLCCSISRWLQPCANPDWFPPPPRPRRKRRKNGTPVSCCSPCSCLPRSW